MKLNFVSAPFLVQIYLTYASTLHPNIVIIVVDDLGIGDLGCFGNDTIDTPNIDSLCKTGAKLSHHVSTAVLCTPSRAALLTGRYAIRMGLTGLQDTPPVIIYAAGRAGLPSNETTFAKVAQQAGYFTAVVGKWHLGLNDNKWGDQLHGPLGHGFDYFYGLPHTLVDGFELEESFFTIKECFKETDLPIVLFCLIPLRFLVGRKSFFSILFIVMFLSWFLLEHFRITRSNWWQRSMFMEKFCNSFLIENNEVVEKPIDLKGLSSKLIDKTVTLIRQRSEDVAEKPYLIYHSFAHVHTPLATDERYEGVSRHGSYGDVIAEMDAGVGRILDAIKDSGQEEDTLVYLTSDHGGDYPQLGHLGGYNGVYRGGKSNGALEGGMRVPGIIKWPRNIEPGSVIDQPTSLLDVFPTIVDIVGDTEIRLNPNQDGKSMLKLLRGEMKHLDRNIIHFCDSEIFAMRSSFDGMTYKVIFKEPVLTLSGSCYGEICPCYGPNIRTHEFPLLYNIEEDPTESNPKDPSSELYKNITGRMRKPFFEFYSESASTNMPSQFKNMLNVLPMPWLQPYTSP